MADRVRARCARVRDDCHGAAEAERFAQGERLTLRLILGHARGLNAPVVRRTTSLFVVILPPGHPAARGSEHYRNIFAPGPTRLLPRLRDGPQEQVRGPVQSTFFTRT